MKDEKIIISKELIPTILKALEWKNNEDALYEDDKKLIFEIYNQLDLTEKVKLYEEYSWFLDYMIKDNGNIQVDNISYKNDLVKFKELIDSPDTFKITEINDDGKIAWGVYLPMDNLDKIKVLFESGLATVLLKYRNYILKPYQYDDKYKHEYGIIFNSREMLDSFIKDIKAM